MRMARIAITTSSSISVKPRRREGVGVRSSMIGSSGEIREQQRKACCISYPQRGRNASRKEAVHQNFIDPAGSPRFGNLLWFPRGAWEPGKFHLPRNFAAKTDQRAGPAKRYLSARA